MEEELRCLREEVRRRDDFLALATHELRNPLHALGLQLALARSAAKTAGASGVEDLLNLARTTLNRYLGKATVLLEMIRLGQSAYPVELEDVDLAAALVPMLEAARSESEYHGAELQLVAPSVGTIRTDPVAIGHVVSNLLSNAFKHSGASEIRLILRRAGTQHVEVVVADNGCGISAAQQERIFEKFSGSYSRDGGGGFGLGLWIARELGRALGGNLSLRSQQESGSEFILSIPIQPRTPPSRSHDHASSYDASP